MSLFDEAVKAHAKQVEALLQLAVKYRVLKISDGGVCVELSPEAFAPSWQPQTATQLPTVLADEPPCRCGHHAVVAHNDAGLCLEGCNPEECRPVEAK
jgi:hypothetical protein